MFKRSLAKIKRSIDPDDIFLDSTNLPSFDTQQFEGHLEQPVSRSAFYFLGAVCALSGLLFLLRLGNLQIVQGAAFAERSENNTLRRTPIFAERGIITDRQGVELAWNDQGRHYLAKPGFAHLLGYTAYPTPEEVEQVDYLSQEMVGREGAEKVFEPQLHGRNGVKIEETDVRGEIYSDHILDVPQSGEDLSLAVDSRLQENLHQQIQALIKEGRFQAGAGVIMDIQSGELIALVSAPEFERQNLSAYLQAESRPFLNRPLLGLYTPGSVVKPFMALAALNEGVITPEKKILSTGALVIPNPYDPTQSTTFKDWKAHGYTDMRQAIAVSSDTYFYEVGGGYQDQPGLGISRIDKYLKLFGFGAPTGIDFLGEAAGVIPTPEWKKANFDGEEWYLGNTYHSAIGQYGWQVTALQMARAVGAIATNGRLVTPTVAKPATSTPPEFSLINEIKPEYYQVVREGMRLGVTNGTAVGLNLADYQIAAKTGTAELGVSKGKVNSWVTGFFPYQAPRYAFAVVMEAGSSSNLIGAVFVTRQFFDWLKTVAPEYLETKA